MAIYHLNAKTISRGKGQSATASAAYRSGERLYSERYGESNFYVREVKPEIFILKPEHAPEWCLNREQLWNEVEKIEKPSNAQLAREFNIALPIELSNEKQVELIKEYVQTNFVDKGMVADVSIHRDAKYNPHFHIMLTTRPFNPDGSWGIKANRIILKDENGDVLYYPSGDKKSRKNNSTDWNDKDTMKEWREQWATLTNTYLEQAGSKERISEKSYLELGEEKQATIHEGYVAREIEKRGEVSERVEQNRQIKKANYDRTNERKEAASNTTIHVIMQPLSPKEKGILKEIAKELKVYVNYENLIDKERMVHNWQRSEKINQIIRPDTFDDSVLKKIESTKEAIDKGKDLLEKQYMRIFNTYYPELSEKTFSDYGKMKVAQTSLVEDRVLPLHEVVAVLEQARDEEIKDVLQSILKNPYEKSRESYMIQLAKASKQLDQFYEENQVTEETVSTLSEEKIKKFTDLYRYRDLQYSTVQLIQGYQDRMILSAYPTADLSALTFKEKEEISKAISYYGNTLSYTKLVQASQETFISKYTTYEQKIGLQFIKKLENGTFTEEDLQALETDYQKKEIFDTVSNATTQSLFLHEVAQNPDLSVEHFPEQGEKIGSSPSLLEKLAKNGTIYDNLLRASEDNARRKAEKINKKAPKAAQSVQDKKNKKEKTRLPSI